MIFLISLIVYIICVYIGVKYTMRNWSDTETILTLKEKTLVMIWFIFFISSQMLIIHEIFNWTGVFEL
ncbi:hypothetical protein Kirov_217 [Bacillus phage Kirov]|uniref:Uncharacterized protein n=1 Tax=Bacillus phage Kirov TaxID=2783539 RepID=A0A7U3NKN9_9CAUD|nr:hypothetical protein PQE67_gp087 [Bacillus phage Kirov]QOV08416.1 hypothetical protein Kirov_217 [Bacillus phage Kirov]